MPFTEKKFGSEPDKREGVSETPKNVFDLNNLKTVAEFWEDKSFKAKMEAAGKKSGIEQKKYTKQQEKYRGIQDVLESLRYSNLSTSEGVENLLNKDLDELEKKLMENKDPKEVKEMDNELTKTRETLDFIRQQAEHPEKSAQFNEWFAEIKKAASDKSMQETERDLEGIRHELEEREKEKELLRDISEKGGVAIWTSLPRKYSREGYAGFGLKADTDKLSFLNDPAQVREESGEMNFDANFGSAYDSKTYKHPREVFKEQKIYEVVTVAPITKDIYQEVKVPITEKKMGIFKKTTEKTERKKVGVEAIPHNELVAGKDGRAEPAYRLVYFASDFAEKSTYQDYTGRGGNMLSVEIILPESVAKRTMERIKANPKIIRDIIKEAVTKGVGISEKAWEEGDEYTKYPIRPPYEKWVDGSSGKNKIYIQEEKDNEGFKPEWVMEI